MKYLRRISTSRLLALCAATVAFGVGAVALAMAATGGGEEAPGGAPAGRRPRCSHGTDRPGSERRIQFTNHLINGSSVQGADPILSGASGRLWASSDGHLRLELQADSNSEGATSDSQVVSDGHRAWVYDSGSNTVFEGTLPGHDKADGGNSANGQPPSLAKSRRASRSWPTAPW